MSAIVDKPLPNLRKLGFISNWKVDSLQFSDCLLLNCGQNIDEIATDVAARLQEDVQHNRGRVGIANDHPKEPGKYWAIRVVHRKPGSHSSKTDVIFSRRNDNLYVRYDVGGFSWIRYLHRLLKTTAMIVLSLVLLATYLQYTNAVGSIIREYARRYAPAVDEFGVAMSSGWRYDVDSAQWVPEALPSLLDLVRNDPQLVFSGLVLPMGVVVASMGAIVYVLPNEAFNFPCRFLGWPTPKHVDAFIRANVGEVRAMVNHTLYEGWRVTKLAEQQI